MKLVNLLASDSSVHVDRGRRSDSNQRGGTVFSASQTVPESTGPRIEPRAAPADLSAAASTAKPDEKQLDSAVKQLNSALQQAGRSLKFSIDKDTGITVVQVRDQATNEVIRQIPPEETLNLAKNLDQHTNLLFTARV